MRGGSSSSSLSLLSRSSLAQRRQQAGFSGALKQTQKHPKVFNFDRLRAQRTARLWLEALFPRDVGSRCAFPSLPRAACASCACHLAFFLLALASLKFRASFGHPRALPGFQMLLFNDPDRPLPCTHTTTRTKGRHNANSGCFRPLLSGLWGRKRGGARVSSTKPQPIKPTSQPASQVKSAKAAAAAAFKAKQSIRMAERKAVIKNADMSEDMQQDAVDCASQVRGTHFSAPPPLWELGVGMWECVWRGSNVASS